MRFYFDLGLGKLVTRPGFNSLLAGVDHKRGDSVRMEMDFSRSGTPEAIPGTLLEMVYVVKATTQDDAVSLLLADTWALDSDTGLWFAPLNAATTSLQALLSGQKFKDLLAEFSFTTTTMGPTSSQTLVARVSNDVWKGTEGTPLSLATPEQWLEARNLAQRTEVIRYAPVTGFAITAASRIDQFQRWTPAAALATGAFAFPSAANCLDGQQILINTSRNIAAMTFTAGTGNTLTGAPTSLSSGTDYVFIYDAIASEFIRIGGNAGAGSSGVQLLANGVLSFAVSGTDYFVTSSTTNPLP